MAARTNSLLLAFLGWTALASVLDMTATAAPAPATKLPANPAAPPVAPAKAVSIAALNRLLKEADAAMDAKDYATAITKTEELIKAVNPQTSNTTYVTKIHYPLDNKTPSHQNFR